MMSNTRHRGGRRSARGLFGALAIALTVSLLPGPAQAHFAAPGLNGAQLDLGPNHGDVSPVGAQRTVTGKGFVGNDVARIFQCPYGATDLLAQCQAIGAAPTDADGGFSVSLTMHSVLATPSGPVQCARFMGATLCAVAAATYDALQQPTATAQHYICFQGPQPCNPPNDGITTTTTTTTVPPPGPEWEPAAPMNVARHDLATAVGNDGRIYAMGGKEPDGDAIASAERYDSCKKSWSSLPPMLTPRTGFAAATGPDGRIYVIGGRERLFGTSLSTVEAYDPVTNAWSMVASLALGRTDLAATTGSDGRIYAIGGRAPRVSPSVGTEVFDVATVEAYDTATNQWQVVAPLSAPRSGHGAATGPDGRVYVVGGSTQLAQPSTVERYTLGPAGTPGTWETTKAKQRLPLRAAVTAGPDGLVYVIGGLGPPNAGSAKTTYVYDPAADTWTASTEALTTGRSDAGAAAGLDGRIYALGGTDDPEAVEGPPPLSSTEAARVAPSSCPAGSPPPADFDGDGDTDISVFRPSTGTWFAKDGATSAWGAQGDIPVPGDYDGDRITDVAIFRPDTGLWAIDHSGGGPDTFVTYGIPTDVPVPADYDGDGKTDIAVYRPEYATWWVHRSSDGADSARTFGLSTDVPVPGDYDGDGSADLAIFRDGTWFVQPASGGSYTATAYGIGGDVPVPGDYDSDRRTDMAVFRPSDGTWALHRSSDGVDEIFGFGIAGDIPVPGDYDGDWRWDPAVFRPSTGEWFVETGQSASWGTATDVPLSLPPAVRLAHFENRP